MFLELTDETIDSGVELSGSEKQWILVDLGEAYTINQMEIIWIDNPSEIDSVQIQPVYEQQTEDGYLIRPQYAWRNDGAQDIPVTPSSQITDITLGNYNFMGLYYAATWLNDPFYNEALQHALNIVSGAMNNDETSNGYGLFHNIYNIRMHEYTSEYGDNISTTLSNCDIATRTKAYADWAGDPAAANIGIAYKNFLADKYKQDGIICAGYHYETGEAKMVLGQSGRIRICCKTLHTA